MSTKSTWTAAQCWPDFTDAMQQLRITADTSDAEIDAMAEREAPEAARALGCRTSVEEFAEAMRAWRDGDR